MLRFESFVVHVLLLISTLLCERLCMSDSEFKYAHQRDVLKEKEREFAGNIMNLTQDEIIANSYMEYLKWAEFERTRTAFPPARPIEQVLGTIKASKVYSVLKKLPKGGNMHTHMNHVVSKRKMLNEIFNSSLLDYLCVDTRPGSFWKLDFYDTPPAGWVKVKSNAIAFSIDNILQHITLINVLSNKAKDHPTDSQIRWQEMQPMFGTLGSEIVRFGNYTRWHIKALFESALEENVQYLESRTGHHDLYYVDDSAKGGHLYTGDGENAAWYEMVRDVLREFKREHPDFIGFREIVSGKRYKSKQTVQDDINRCIRLKQKYPDIIGGFDLIAEEDRGYSLLFFIDDFDDDSFKKSHLPLYFHTAETSWPNDLLTSLHADDPVSTADNVYEAIILGSKRVGHGIGFVNHPYLMQVMKERKVAVEANPVSNMLLGYVNDQRHHPAITYIRYGIPVVLGADDPASMGYDEFTVDWYEAFMGWGLNLADLKQLAFNSLNYSTMPVDMKAAALQKWELSWDKFVSDLKHEACTSTLSSESPEIHSIYPKDGRAGFQSNVRVFGRNFQSGICQRIICQFGGIQTHGQYVYNHMITCPSPADLKTGVFPFTISFDHGNTFMTTNMTFSNRAFTSTEYTEIFVG